MNLGLQLKDSGLYRIEFLSVVNYHRLSLLNLNILYYYYLPSWQRWRCEFHSKSCQHQPKRAFHIFIARHARPIRTGLEFQISLISLYKDSYVKIPTKYINDPINQTSNQPTWL